MSTHSTRWPVSANATARFRVVVVLATPPFWLANAMTLAACGRCPQGAPVARMEPIRRVFRPGAAFSFRDRPRSIASPPDARPEPDALGRRPEHGRSRAASCAGGAGGWRPPAGARASGSAATRSRRASARCPRTSTPTRRRSSSSCRRRAVSSQGEQAYAIGGRRRDRPPLGAEAAHADRRRRAARRAGLRRGVGHAPDVAAARGRHVGGAALGAARRAAPVQGRGRRRAARASPPPRPSARRRSSRWPTWSPSVRTAGDVASATRDVGDGRGLGASAAAPRTFCPRAGSLTRRTATRGEEELFVVLDGDGHVLLDDRRALPLRPGTVVSRARRHGRRARLARRRRRPDAAGVRHPRAARPVLLPAARGRSRGSGGRARFRVEPVDYWDGEADPRPAALFDRELLVVTGKGGVGQVDGRRGARPRAARRGLRTIVAEVERARDVSRARRAAGAGRSPRRTIAPGLNHISIDPHAGMEEYLPDQLPSARSPTRYVHESGRSR